MLVPPPTGDERRAVIVIDDDQAVCSALKFSLEVEGFEVSTFASAAQALKANLPLEACFIVDYHLPGMNGLQLILALRAERGLVPAILITSHPTTVLREAAAAQGVPIVEKPLLSDALLDGIRRTMDRD